MIRVRFLAIATFSLTLVLLVAACDSSGETPTTPAEQPDVSAPSSTEAPATTEAPTTTEAPATTDDGGVDPYIVAAIIAAVVLIGVGAWFIGRSSGGNTETETTVDTRPQERPAPPVRASSTVELLPRGPGRRAYHPVRVGSRCGGQ